LQLPFSENYSATFTLIQDAAHGIEPQLQDQSKKAEQ